MKHGEEANAIHLRIAIADIRRKLAPNPKREAMNAARDAASPVAEMPVLGVPIVRAFADMAIFICHASEDKSSVRNLYEQLVNDGYQPWLDEEDLLTGQNWEREIIRAVRRSHVVLICLSAKSVTKAGFLQKEIKMALDVLDEQPEGIIFIVPARLGPCDVPESLRSLHYVDLFDERGYAKLRRALNRRAEQLGFGGRAAG
jgi:hypothetical protein